MYPSFTACKPLEPWTKKREPVCCSLRGNVAPLNAVFSFLCSVSSKEMFDPYWSFSYQGWMSWNSTTEVISQSSQGCYDFAVHKNKPSLQAATSQHSRFGRNLAASPLCLRDFSTTFYHSLSTTTQKSRQHLYDTSTCATLRPPFGR